MFDDNETPWPLPAEKKTPKRRPAHNAEMHDKPMYPVGPRKTLHATLEEFPAYLPNPPTEKTRAPPDDPDAPPRFKMTHNTKTIPCSPIATNMRNLKLSYPSAFKS